MRAQEEKLKQIDAQNRRTHAMLEQFNNGRAQASTAELQADGDTTTEAFGGSPARKMEPKTKQEKPKISDFELEGVIALGNFGTLHKAFNKRELRVCALKVLRNDL